MIELIDFSKSYSKKSDFSVKNVSITVNKGSITGLIGPNGSGKSTILKAICGIHYPTSGIIQIDGKSTLEATNEIHKLLGYVPEVPSLPPEMTVSSFLNYAAEVHGLSDNEIEAAIAKTVKDCSLEKLLSKKIKTLSKGQKQRVSFAQALIHNPSNIILDEPMSGLDPAQIIQMRQLIKKLSESKAILMSTHILQEIYSLCSELYILNEGEIAAKGTEQEILSKTSFKTLEECFINLTTKSDE